MNYPYYQPYQIGYQQPVPDQLAMLRQNQYQQQMQQMQPPVQQPQQPSNSIIWVQGEAGAKSYLVAPGSTVMLLDSEGSTFYLKSADNSGMPMPLRIFDYKERTEAQKPASLSPEAPGMEYVTRAEFDALAARVAAQAGQKVAVVNKTMKSKLKEDNEDE